MWFYQHIKIKPSGVVAIFWGSVCTHYLVSLGLSFDLSSLHGGI